MAQRLRQILLLLLLLAVARPARAGDGAIRWRTLRGPGIEVHYPSQLEPLARRANRLVLPLYGDLSPAEQDRVVAPAAQPKLILATNVAESSVTIDGTSQPGYFPCEASSGRQKPGARMARG